MQKINTYDSYSTGKGIFEPEISLSDLLITADDILLSLGYSPVEGNNESLPPDAHFIEMTETAVKLLQNLCVIKAGYRILDVDKSAIPKDGLSLGGVFFATDKIVTSELKDSEKAALFVCSIGPGMENHSKELMNNGDAVLSYIVNITASVVTEKAVDFLHDHIKNHMKEQGLNVTNRYSPGYCNWPVTEQRLLFSLLPEKFCGVTLNESSLMIPIKSTSGIIGIGKTIKWKEYICDKCGIKDCTYRSIRRGKAPR